MPAKKTRKAGSRQSRSKKNHVSTHSAAHIEIPPQLEMHAFGHRAGAKQGAGAKPKFETESDEASNSFRTDTDASVSEEMDSSSSSSSSSSSFSSGSDASFFKEITLKFLHMLNTIKLYHWKTHSYAMHKATDDLYSKLNGNIDKFVETMLGKTGGRINLMGVKQLPLDDYNSVPPFKTQIEDYKSFLVGLDKDPFIKQMSNTDLLNIRDEILGDLNQFLYLLTFK